MSNTSTLSPYESSSSTSSNGTENAAECVVGAAAKIAALARWLTEETDDEKAAVQRYKIRRRQETLAAFGQKNRSCVAPNLSAFSQINLHIRDMGTLIQSAKKLGYCIQQTALPSNLHSRVADLVLLADLNGNRVAVERNESGKLRLTSAGGLAPLQKMVQQHTFDRALEHLTKIGMTIQTAVLSNGEVQVLARGNTGHPAASNAEIKTRVHADGTVWMDVDNVRGNHCENMVRDMAQAVGAQPSDTKKKAAFYEMPGEPARITVKA